MTDPAKRMEFLLNQLQKKVINQFQFQRECAYWLLEDECWNDLQPLKLPLKPEDSVIWQGMDKEEREALDEDYFHKHKSILWFVDRYNFCQWTNFSRIKQLREFMRYLLPDDEPARRKYLAKIKQFIQQIRKNRNYYRGVESIDDYGREIMAEFGGKVERG